MKNAESKPARLTGTINGRPLTPDELVRFLADTFFSHLLSPHRYQLVRELLVLRGTFVTT